MAATGKVRARLASAVESALRGIVRPSRWAANRMAGALNVEALEQRVMLSSAAGVEIAGQSVGFAGKSLTFNADLSPDLAGGSPSYQWNLLNQSGSSYVPPGGLPGTTASSFVVPGTLPAGSYSVTLAVSESGTPTQNATFPIEVLADPQPGNMIYGTVPSVGGDNEGFVSAMVRQADGKIVVAGYWGSINLADNEDYYSCYVARFNPDLTLDTTFNNYHGSVDSSWPLAIYQHPADPRTDGDFNSIQKLAINPTNQDIIVVGSGNHDGWWRLQVAELVSKPTVEPDGTVVAAGSFDPQFNAGKPFDYVATAASGDPLSSVGQDVIVQPTTGDLLVGGASNDVHTMYGGSALVGTDSDFLLLELRPDGTLDTTNFNPDGPIPGVANQPGVSGAFAEFDGGVGPDGQLSSIYPPSRIVSLVTDAAGDIYAAGIGSPPSGSSYPSNNEGIVIVKYLPAGTIDTTHGFGTSGEVYTDSTTFNGSQSAFPSAMELLPSGNLLVVGQANPSAADPLLVPESFPDKIDANVVLAEYNATSGTLNSS